MSRSGRQIQLSGGHFMKKRRKTSLQNRLQNQNQQRNPQARIWQKRKQVKRLRSLVYKVDGSLVEKLRLIHIAHMARIRHHYQPGVGLYANQFFNEG